MITLLRERKDLLFYILLVINIVVRFVIFFNSQPVVPHDFDSYYSLTEAIKNWDFSHFNGSRTPMYPLLLLIMGANLKLGIVYQMILGIFISMIMYKTVLVLSGNTILAFLGGLFYSVHIPLIGCEIVLQTETLATFFTVLLIYLVMRYAKANKNLSFKILLVSICISLLTLTRPGFVILVVLVPLPLIYYDLKIRKLSYYQVIKQLAVYGIPIFIFIGGWCFFNYNLIQRFTISSFSGYSLVNRISNFVEDAPPEYNQLKEVFLHNRELRNREFGTPYNTVHTCTDTLMKTLHLKFWELSDLWKKMAISTIKAHPDKYVFETAKGFVKIWKPMGFYDSENRLIILIRLLEQVFLILIYLLFFSIPVFYFMRKKNLKIDNITLLMITQVFLISFGVSGLSAAMEFGDPRFSLPYVPLIFMAVLLFYFKQIFPQKADNTLELQ